MKLILLLLLTITVVYSTRLARSSRPYLSDQRNHPNVKIDHPTEVNLDYKNYTWKAIPKINKDNNGDNYLIPVKILETVQRRSDVGLLALAVLVTESTCPKDLETSQVTSDNCQQKIGGKRFIYHITVYRGPKTSINNVSQNRVVGEDEII